jgi:RNA ligase
MMIYEFPMIQHLDDVLDAIKDSPEFIVVQKDGYQVVNYVVMSEETFPAVNVAGGSAEMRKERALRARLRRECRGLIFDMEGKIINRRYHKFFNVNERDETAAHRLNWSAPHVILEKLDGSMVSPCVVDGNVRWMTKMGITDTSMEAEVFVAQHPDYVELAERYLSHGMTPIFEWCSNKNRIVIDYPEDRLVLTGMRDNLRGTYLLHDALEALGERYGIPVVQAWDSRITHDVLAKIVRQSENIEGVVVRFDDGHMVKIKSDWYVRIHKVKSLLENEREVVGLALRNELDDLYPVLAPEDVVKVKSFVTALDVVLEDIANDIAKAIAYCKDVYKSKKEFALVKAADYTPLTRSMIFRHFDAPPEPFVVYQELVDLILKNSLTNTAYRKVKEEFLKELNYE